MHFEVLVEDRSGSIALESIMGKILGENGAVHSWEIHAYRGIGRIPGNLRGVTDPKARILLDRLPNILQGYGKRLQGFLAAVVVVVDLDDKNCIAFKQELLDVLDSCNPRPNTLFRIAIEEGEAWLLGDRAAVKAAYPNAMDAVLDGYVQDSICGTWEVLADAVHPGGAEQLQQVGYPAAGIAKSEWARTIAPLIDIESNQSKSFQVFRDGVRALAGIQS